MAEDKQVEQSRQSMTVAAEEGSQEVTTIDVPRSGNVNIDNVTKSQVKSVVVKDNEYHISTEMGDFVLYDPYFNLFTGDAKIILADGELGADELLQMVGSIDVGDIEDNTASTVTPEMKEKSSVSDTVEEEENPLVAEENESGAPTEEDTEEAAASAEADVEAGQGVGGASQDELEGGKENFKKLQSGEQNQVTEYESSSGKGEGKESDIPEEEIKKADFFEDGAFDQNSAALAAQISVIRGEQQNAEDIAKEALENLDQAERDKEIAEANRAQAEQELEDAEADRAASEALAEEAQEAQAAAEAAQAAAEAAQEQAEQELQDIENQVATATDFEVEFLHAGRTTTAESGPTPRTIDGGGGSAASEFNSNSAILFQNEVFNFTDLSSGLTPGADTLVVNADDSGLYGVDTNARLVSVNPSLPDNFEVTEVSFTGIPAEFTPLVYNSGTDSYDPIPESGGTYTITNPTIESDGAIQLFFQYDTSGYDLGALSDLDGDSVANDISLFEIEFTLHAEFDVGSGAPAPEITEQDVTHTIPAKVSVVSEAGHFDYFADVPDTDALGNPITVNTRGVVFDVLPRQNDGAVIGNEANVPDIEYNGGEAVDNIETGAGDDSILGGGGNDTVDAASGDDYIDGGEGNDSIIGNAGNDTLRAIAGDDTLDGGAGTGDYFYANGTDAISVDLNDVDSLASAVTQGSNTHNLLNIEHILGSSGNDTIDGNNQANILNGADGDDIFAGQGGNDTIIGGNGQDMVEFSDETIGITMDLSSAVGGETTVNIAGGNIDVISEVEHITGSNLGDNLTGDADQNMIDGAIGADVISGGAGVDYLDGGAGNDTISFSGATEGLTLDLSSQSAIGAATINGTAVAQLPHGFDGKVFSLVDFATEDDEYIFDFEDITSTNFDDSITDATNNGVAGKRFTLGAGNDTLNAADGDDIIIAGTGDDVVDGGTGNDQAVFTDLGSGITVTFSADDNFSVANAGDTKAFTAVERISATNSADVLNGSTGDDIIVGNNGDDSFASSAGNDNLNAGSGTDSISFIAETDGISVNLDIANVVVNSVTFNAQIATGTTIGTDTLVSFERLEATNFDDTIIGSASSDFLSGMNGDDILVGQGGSDTLDGGAGNDTVTYSGLTATALTIDLSTTYDPGGSALNGGAEQLRNIEGLVGGSGADSFRGSTVANYIGGDAGNDTIDGNEGNDTLDGGAGTNWLYYDQNTEDITVDMSLGGGTFTVTVERGATDEEDSATNFLNFESGSGDDSIIGDTLNNNIISNDGNDTIDGGLGNDTIQGGNGNDTIFGGDGNDQLYAGNGNDSLDAGAGNDTVFGRPDDDTLIGGTGTDVLNLASETGTLTIVANSTLGGAGTVTGSVYMGTDEYSGFETILGAALDDTFTGGAGNDHFSGSTGADQFTGGAGDDTFDGGGDIDIIYFNTGSETQAVNADLSANAVTNDGFGDSDTVTNVENIIASTFGDTLIGSTAANYFEGGSGDDVLTGGDGDDTLLGGAGNDLINGGAGADSLVGGGGADDTLTYAGSASSVNANFTTGSASSGGSTDDMSGFEHFVGSDSGDTIRFVSVFNSGFKTVDMGAGGDLVRIDADQLLGANFSVDGGTGTDELRVDGGSLSGDASTYTSKLANMELLDLVDTDVTGGTLTISGSDIVAFTDSNNELEIEYDDNDFSIATDDEGGTYTVTPTVIDPSTTEYFFDHANDALDATLTVQIQSS